MKKVLLLLFGLSLVVLLGACKKEAGSTERLVVFAPSSLGGILESLGAQWARQTGQPEPVFSFGATSRIVRQVQEGARADVLITADQRWMDQAAPEISRASRTNLFKNRLVLVRSRKSNPPFSSLEELHHPENLKIAMASEPVPAGRYAREALEHHKLWSSLKRNLVYAPNVRASLRLVELGEADLGVVYATDARASDLVEVVFSFPPNAHSPIVYPGAITTRGEGNKWSASFLRFLHQDPGSLETLKKASFAPYHQPQ